MPSKTCEVGSESEVEERRVVCVCPCVFFPLGEEEGESCPVSRDFKPKGAARLVWQARPGRGFSRRL